MPMRLTISITGRASRQLNAQRSGHVVILFAVLLLPMLVCIAMAVDMGYLMVVRTQLQAACDSAALAGAAELYQRPVALETLEYTISPDGRRPRELSRQYVRLNAAGGHRSAAAGSDPLDVNLNLDNHPDGDIVLGRILNPGDHTEQLVPDMDRPNSVQVRIPLKSGHLNGPVSLFFAKALGIHASDLQATAVATVDYPVLLPFTISERKWQSISSGGDGDRFAYTNGSVKAGSDGIVELQVFPDRNWDGNDLPPGNFGLLHIGSDSGTHVLREQIDMGPSGWDLSGYGGTLTAAVQIPGETGVNGDIKTAFVGGSADGRRYTGIIGRPRLMPIYSDASGSGGNALFTISRFVTVRVIAVKMTGHPKSIIVQPVESLDELAGLRLTR